MKIIITLEQLKRAVHTSNEIKYPITFKEGARDFDKWVNYMQNNHPELYHSS